MYAHTHTYSTVYKHVLLAHITDQEWKAATCVAHVFVLYTFEP